MTFRARALILLGSLCCLSVVGCSAGLPSTVPVNGKVVWEDGKPVAGGNLQFVPAGSGRAANGYTGKDGAFSLSTFRPDDGAVPGDYTVVVTKISDAGPVAGAGGQMTAEEMMKKMKGFSSGTTKPKVTDPIPQVYTSDKTSPLKWKVEAGSGEAVIKLRKG